MSQPLQTNAPAPASRTPRIFPWVVVGIVAVQLAIFAWSIVNLVTNTQAMDNKFRHVALAEFRPYLAKVNLDLLRGYGMVAIALTLLAWPLTRWWLRKKSGWGRWSIVWRAGLIAGLIWGFAFLRFFYSRPFYFTLKPELQHIYFNIAGWLPDWTKWIIFDILPWVVAGAFAVHYATLLVRWRARSWPLGACRAVGAMTIALSVVSWMGVSAYTGNVEPALRTDSRPNILILASDSLRADHLSCNGYRRQTSPTIDELAAGSMNFTRCFTPISSTLESMTSIMSGQYPHTHGLQHMFPEQKQVRRTMETAPMLADILKRHGYSTSVIGDWCAGIFDMMPMGFEGVDVSTFDNFKVFLTQAVYREHSLLPLWFDNDLGYSLFPSLRSCASFVTPEVVTERLKQRLTEESRRDQPFFITAFYSCTHLPYSINPPYSTLFTEKNYNGQHKGRMDFDVDEFIGSVDIADKWRALPQPEVQQIVGLYDGCVRKFDDVVQELLAHLRRTRQLDNTIILISADHGDDLFEPNCTFGHGLTFNGGDQNSNVPLILKLPGVKQGRKIDRIVRTIDFAPTLLDLAGVAADPRMEGVSLRPYMEGETAGSDLSLAFCGETSYPFCKRYIPGEVPLFIPPMDSTTFVDRSFDCHLVLKEKYQQPLLQTKERCLRTRFWKIVFTPGEHKDIWRLFHLETDPHCERPVNLEHPDVFQQMQEHLLAWMRDHKEPRIRDVFPNGEPSGAVAAASRIPLR
jgi:arylsulfatase A-like enzyme